MEPSRPEIVCQSGIYVRKCQIEQNETTYIEQPLLHKFQLLCCNTYGIFKARVPSETHQWISIVTRTLEGDPDVEHPLDDCEC